MSLEYIKSLNTELAQLHLTQQELRAERDRLFQTALAEVTSTVECLALHAVATRLCQKWATSMLAVHYIDPHTDTLATLESIPFLRITLHLYGSIYDCDLSLFELAPLGGSSEGLRKYSYEMESRVNEVNEAILKLWNEKRRQILALYTIDDFKNFSKRQVNWRDKALFESFRNMLACEGIASRKELEAKLQRRAREWELRQLNRYLQKET